MAHKDKKKTKKDKDVKTKAKKVKPEAEAVFVEPSPPVYLPENPLNLPSAYDKDVKDSVPPPTPSSDFAFAFEINSIPTQFPNLAELTMPHIKEIGVKAALEKLAEIFDCRDYKFNFVQFWFVDILANCLYDTQEKYNLPLSYQKIVLEWILYVFEMIRSRRMNFTRKEMFEILKRATLIIRGLRDLKDQSTFPTPDIVFTDLIEGKIEPFDSCFTFDTVSLTEDSSVSLDENADDDVGSAEYFTKSGSDQQLLDEIRDEEYIGFGEDFHICNEEDDDVNFYQADPRIPVRFLPLIFDVETNRYRYDYSVLDVNLEQSTNSQMIDMEKSENFKKQFAKNELARHRMWAKNVCSSIYGDDAKTDFSSMEDESDDALKITTEQSHDEIENGFDVIKSFVWYVIKRQILRLFYDNFQFTLAKFAMRVTHNAISRKVNETWNVPKPYELTNGPSKKGRKDTKKGKKDKVKGKKGASSLSFLTETPRDDLFILPLLSAVDDEFFKKVFENWKKVADKKSKKRKKKK